MEHNFEFARCPCCASSLKGVFLLSVMVEVPFKDVHDSGGLFCPLDGKKEFSGNETNIYTRVIKRVGEVCLSCFQLVSSCEQC